MRKYLLLATVAGCMFSENAMAGGSISANQQNATVNVRATIRKASQIQNLQDMDFGTLYIANDTTGDLVSMSTAGEVTVKNDAVVAATGEPASGYIGFSAYTTVGYTVTCANGTGDPTNGDSCSLGNGLVLKNVVVDVHLGYLAETLTFGGTLAATSGYRASNINLDAPGIRVELQY